MTIYEANHLGTTVTREVLGRAATNRNRTPPRSTLEADHTVDTLTALMRESDETRRRLEESIDTVDTVLTDALAEIAEDVEGLTRRDVAEIDTRELERLTGLDRATINRSKLAILGVPLKDSRGKAARAASNQEEGDADVQVSTEARADAGSEVDVDVEPGSQDDADQNGGDESDSKGRDEAQ